MEPLRLPVRLSPGFVDQLLEQLVGEGVSDVVLTTEQPLRVKKRGRYLAVSERVLRTEELQDLVAHTSGSGDVPPRVAGGEPKDYSYEVMGTSGRKFSFRVNAIAVQVSGGRSGFEVTIRVLSERPPTLEDQGLVDPGLLAALLSGEHGLYLTVGATGSGKTTLQSAIAVELATGDPRRRVISYESPVEYQLADLGISQTAVPRQVPSFTDAVVAGMRRAPDIIILGEARDPETLREVLTAAETGHGVFASIHAPSVAGVLPRLIEAFPPDKQRGIARRLVDALRVVVYQRLLPTLLGSRVAIRESLVFTPALRQQLSRVDPTEFAQTIRTMVSEHGITLGASARERFAQGLITRDSVQSVLNQSEDV